MGKKLKICGLGLSKFLSAQPYFIHYNYSKTGNLIEELFGEKDVADLCEPIDNYLHYLMG